MTNEEYIKSLPMNCAEQPDYGDDDDGWEIPFMRNVYITSDRMEFWDDYEEALEHECWWLAQERED